MLWFVTCGPRTSPQERVLPYAIIWLQSHDLDRW